MVVAYDFIEKHRKTKRPSLIKHFLDLFVTYDGKFISRSIPPDKFWAVPFLNARRRGYIRLKPEQPFVITLATKVTMRDYTWELTTTGENAAKEASEQIKAYKNEIAELSARWRRGEVD